jgi:uncharacterized repeat protein (TIGR01451 family)
MKRYAWIPLLVSALFVCMLRSIAVGASPPAAPPAGITVTPTMPVLTPTPTPISTPVDPADCDPIIVKQVSPGVAGPGDEVVFTISVVNVGRDAAIDARVFDDVPDYLEILDVQVSPEDQGQEMLPRSGQAVVVDLGTLGQDFETAITIRARIREDAPEKVCIENVAEFYAPNCPGRSAEVLCWGLPESGALGARTSWMLLAGFSAVALGLGLLLANKLRLLERDVR